MSDDNQITTQPPGEIGFSTTPSITPFAGDVTAPPVQPMPWTVDQLVFLAFQAVSLPVLFLFVMHTNPDYSHKLYDNPLGIKMSVAAVSLMAFNVVSYLVICFFLNRAYPRVTRTRGQATLFAAISGLHFIAFTLPGVFVILVGPAAISIMENLVR